MSTPEIVAGYVRCSTDKQEDSPEVQWSIIDSYCAKHNYVIPQELRFTDFDVSASIETPKRPAGGKLFRSAVDRKRRLFNKVVIVRLDRTFRDIYDQEGTFRAFARVGVEFIGVKHNLSRATAQERRNLAYDGVSNQYEREITGERIKEHNEKRHLDGLHTHGIPAMGLRIGAVSSDPLVIVESEAIVVRRMFEIFAAVGGNSYETARRLTEEGLKTRFGHQWRPNSVMRTLRRPHYRRMETFDRVLREKPDIVPEVVPAELVAIVDAILTHQFGHWFRPRTTLTAPKPRGTYTGLLTCGKCGRTLDTHNKPGENARFNCRHAYHEQRPCGGPTFHAPTIDWMIGYGIGQQLEKIAGSLAGETERGTRKVTGPTRDEKLARLRERKQRLIDLYVNAGAISMQDYTDRKAAIDAEESTLLVDDDEPVTIEMISTGNCAELVQNWATLWTADIVSMAKRDLLIATLGVPRGGITLWREETEYRAKRARRNSSLYIAEVTAPKISDSVIRIERIGILPAALTSDTN